MTTPGLLQRPILGGVFGSGRYVLATRPCVANGLHAVRFMVLDPRAGTVLATADTKTEVLQAARRAIRQLLQQCPPSEPTAVAAAQAALWPEAEIDRGAPAVRVRSISRRRRDVFEKSAGKCHYCCRPLILDGIWHVEHMLPRALGGADEIGNLVAACAPCNLAKGDRTAVEFVTQAGRTAREQG
ncbi:MAG: HNH endonuclease [Burkholderiaceae bacterium]|nr:HNH endonuclease [Burkholderiaceae bacterium]